MSRIFLGWQKLAFPNYTAALRTLGAEIERNEPERCDVLLLPGGGDIHPRRYGQALNGAAEIDEERDACELALVWAFAAAGKPVLGICRGLQVVNVAFGGTLRQHIDGHSRSMGRDTFHAVRTDDPLLRSLYGERFTVNSAHHQAIDRLGDGLRVIARAEDGTIEAVRHGSLPVLAVQWHPERLGEAGAKLLKAFLEGWRIGRQIG